MRPHGTVRSLSRYEETLEGLDSGFGLECLFSASDNLPVALLKHGALAIVIHVLVTFIINYCNALSMDLPLKTIQKLQFVQNVVCLLTGTSRWGCITPILHGLHGLIVHPGSQFKISDYKIESSSRSRFFVNYFSSLPLIPF